MLKQMLSTHLHLQKYLFIRGFLISDAEIENMSDFPFYGNWRKEKHGKFWFMAHNLAGMHFYEDKEGKTFFLMGHAYNPFTMEHKEEHVLQTVAESYETDEYITCLNDITGIYVTGVINGDEIEFHVDSSGMQSACYAKINGVFYLSSHPQLIGDICNLSMDSFVKELSSYKWYGRVMGPYLPADLTPFADVKRIVPSIMYKFDGEFSHRRFWFNKPFSDNMTYEEVIESAADILKNNMTLIARKWNNPWISLTGGIDSNTTFAAANDNYDKFQTFSYISAEKEIPDAAAAQKIAEAFNVRHNVFEIPDNSGNFDDYEVKKAIIYHNNGYVAKPRDNELRKRLVLEEHCDCDVEVKSWTSETIRAYWYKHYGRKSMPKLSPKLFRNLYKIFITNRKLAHEIDGIFKEYIHKFEYDKIPDCYPVADMHYNEVTWGSWGGLNISEMKYCFDITIAYNNRKFLDLLFRVPLDMRITDKHHLDMKKYLNKSLYDMNIRVVNMKETDFRAFALNVIFTINSFLPF